MDLRQYESHPKSFLNDLIRIEQVIYQYFTTKWISTKNAAVSHRTATVIIKYS